MRKDGNNGKFRKPHFSDKLMQGVLFSWIWTGHLNENFLKRSIWTKKVFLKVFIKEGVHQGVPQGSVLGKRLFNIYLNNLFYILNDVEIWNYVDDTTPNVCDGSLKVIIEKLEKSTQLAIKWFSHNYMKLNAEKCKFLITGHRFEDLWLNVGETQVL